MTEKVLERNYVIPLRKATIKTARWRRAKKAMITIRSFMKRHMKAEVVKLGHELNELIWERGGKRVPSKVSVIAKKKDGVVKVNIVGIVEKKETPKKNVAEKKEEAKKIDDKAKESKATAEDKKESEEKKSE